MEIFVPIAAIKFFQFFNYFRSKAKKSIDTFTFSGVGNAIRGVVDVMKGTSTIGLFKEAVERIASDVVGGLAVPEEQKDQVNSEVRADIKETGISKVNSK